MAKINSALGSKSFQGGMREFVVEEEVESEPFDMDPGHHPMNQPQMNNSFYEQQQMQQQQQQKINYQQHLQQRAMANSKQESGISDSARRRIEILCGMTNLTKTVEIGDVTFKLTSLKTKDNRNALMSAIKFDGTVEFSFELRKQILARSILSVSDVEINMFLGTDDFKARLDFLDELDEAVSNRLYSEYLELDKEIKEKYALKTEKEAKEVIEEIKK